MGAQSTGSGKDKAAAPLHSATADAWRAYCSNAAWVALWITLSVSIIIVNKVCSLQARAWLPSWGSLLP